MARSEAITNINARSAGEIVKKLKLTTDVEKGSYVQMFEGVYPIRAETALPTQLEGSAGVSAWHRLDAAEVWHCHAGAPLVLSLSYDDGQP